ncbi:hypothetical protein HG536_0E00420 [Torulaspora globosa]|uniref:Restriction of telomere capping protein 1 n=1 Tax=Torulaspora globosa TaxID=48254 RepID=A0A7G3ZHZ6_9SACH|nr:uncharacterized protein HG536_0E00420 [Torulaspora globosa]QLL33132.1 hypothetical protein HG536_0E00420 [Torulaspora globosa]
MYNPPVAKGETATSFGRNEFKPSSFSRSSFRIHHYPVSTQISPMGSSPRARATSRYSLSNSSSFNEGSLRESLHSDSQPAERAGSEGKRNHPVAPKCSGPMYSSKARKELSSIDKINDPSSNALICAGTTHLGYYRFSPEDRSVVCLHDYVAVNNRHSNVFSPNFKKRARQSKLSTIADVKTGFHNHKNYVAVCRSSTVISVYDVNRTTDADDALVATLSDHTRSVNSFDFNTSQTSLLISGGQDGSIKIWDLRSSGTKNSRRCDVNINTASDSVRDVKWMPFQNYVTGGQQDVRNGSNAGLKFASIHDSGLLLTFDLRQPSQIEKRINAHSGPGLCLSWHPNLEYIATGGRDGKCSLWNVGDRFQGDNMSSFYTPNSAPTAHLSTLHANTNLAALPEITITTGLPVTKLKFRPSYERNVLNSILALSPMTNDAALNVYSLARKYIPKHVLHKSTQTLGLVWWDEKLIFDIDKDNSINGWDLTQEPTILDNLSKCVTCWRDIEGNGLLFLDQNSGGYEMQQNQPTVQDDDRKSINQKVGAGPLTSSIGNHAGIMNSLKKGISHSTLSSYSGDRPSFYKSGFSFNAKSPSMGFSHNTSSVSSSPYPSQNEMKNVQSPVIVTLDLPYILSNMRLSSLPPDRNKLRSPEVSAIRESPVKVFKFLARELEFSCNNEKREGNVKSIDQRSSMKDEDIETELMQRFGLSENTTWAALMNKKGEQEAKANRESGSTLKSPKQSKKETLQKIISNEEERSVPRKKRSALTESIHCLTSGLEPKIEQLLELIPICSDNASVYSYIDDLSNFKIWLLIRDSLLWDLKRLSSGYPSADPESAQGKLTEDGAEFVAAHNLNETGSPGCSSSITSDVNSFVEETPQAFSTGVESGTRERAQVPETASKLKQQLMEDNGKITSHEQEIPVGSYNSISSAKWEDLNQKGKQNVNDADIVITDDDDVEVEAIRAASAPASSSNGVGATNIPILQKRKQRQSFIDTFMTDVRSPSDINAEGGFSSRNRHPHSLVQSSPSSKLSSLQSLASGTSPLTALRKITERTDFISPFSPKRLPSYASSNFEQLIKTRPANEVPKDNGPSKLKHITPPWSTRRLIKQLYQQAVEMGNILLAVNILLLFQDIYQLAPVEVVKDSLARFTTILHQYELFEISAAILKYCPWDDIMSSQGGESLVSLFCERCHNLITNDSSKERFSLESQKAGNNTPMSRFGHWYCDSCKKPNSLCVLCELPMKKMTMAMLECGHEGHYECLQSWFLTEGMTECPGGCSNEVLI